jgi:hypothetical protein
LRRISPDGTVKTASSDKAKAGPKAVARWSEEELDRYRSFTRLDADAETYVAKTLDLFASWGGTGVVVLTPTHPEVLSAAREAGWERRHAELLRLLERLRQEYDFAVVDMTSVDAFAGDPDGFFDAAHMTTENQRLMVDAVLEQAGDRLR